MWDRPAMVNPVWCKIEINTSKDIDACIKPILDILQQNKVFINDSQVLELKVSKIKISPKKLESIKVWVCEI